MLQTFSIILLAFIGIDCMHIAHECDVKALTLLWLFGSSVHRHRALKC